MYSFLFIYHKYILSIDYFEIILTSFLKSFSRKIKDLEYIDWIKFV